ncbi:LAMI_0H05138g1_1 [Lachancea mirantina]|uniref:LAMI_0H05138g1_1 n=1 Tax=Lachancea mirantina TaxID=1230905 RepID=A0A1G4KEZ3_9SACH|nr:LAMI_0H05138g1_1 [Lachancea mirantina]
MDSSAPYALNSEDDKRWKLNRRSGKLNKLSETFARQKNIIFVIFCVLFVFFWFGSSKISFSSASPKVVLILAVNEGGGVLKWKGEQEWAIERISIQNKRAYAKKHGYGLTLKDMRTARRYSHEYREGWQKVEILKQTMREFPDAEWFWWLDMETLIMEPEMSLDKHIFSRLDEISYRMLDEFNPLNLPLDIPYVDYSKPVDLLITQDCGGFNLGSFLIKNSEWSKLLLDMWWDPVCYEQKHMVWEHREQDALEALYAFQPWIREKTAFLPLRTINAFPPGACSEFENDPRFFYKETDHDFVVNMAGCSFGRDCWAEIQRYGSLLEASNRRWFRGLF